MDAVRNRLEPAFPESPALGRNLGAAAYLAENFAQTIQVLYQSLRDDDRTAAVNGYVQGPGENPGRFNKLSVRLEVKRLESQRPLTAIEKEYLESVEALSIFNAHLAAILREAPDIADVFFSQHFAALHEATLNNLEDGGYQPMIVIGTGVAGDAAAGELARLFPELAGEALFADEGREPGGPFDIPRGPGWKLNSAGPNGPAEPTLPDSPEVIADQTGVPEEATVRAYGAPLPFYPGERVEKKAARPGDINTVTDYLTNLGKCFDGRYARNDEFARVIKAQFMMLARKMLFRTEVLNVEPVEPGNEDSDLWVDLVLHGPDGSMSTIRQRTSFLIDASGGGEPFYGFDLAGSRAEQVLAAVEEQPEDEFPVLSPTLGAFNALASLEGSIKQVGSTLVVYGNGNSADTLIEYLSGLFESDNPAVKNIEKIYVLTTGELSDRFRYAQNADVQGRNGMEGIVEQIRVRVNDVDFADPDLGPAGGVVFYNQNGQIVTLDGKEPKRDSAGKLLTEPEGNTLIGNAGIAATGFDPKRDQVYAKCIPEDASLLDEGVLEAVTLPTNRKVSVGDKLASYRRVRFVGTASRSAFDPIKLAQLPPPPREALIRNGAENAVAVGFRTRDVQAAIRLLFEDYLRELKSSFQASQRTSRRRYLEDQESVQSFSARNEVRVPRIPREDLPPIKRNVDSDAQVLSPLLLYSLKGLRLREGEPGKRTAPATESPDGEQLTLPDPAFEAKATMATPQHRYVFELGESETGNDLVLRYVEGEPAADDRASAALVAELERAIASPYFQAYALEAASTRRANKRRLRINVEFRNGRLDLRKSYAEPI